MVVRLGSGFKIKKNPNTPFYSIFTHRMFVVFKCRVSRPPTLQLLVPRSTESQTLPNVGPKVYHRRETQEHTTCPQQVPCLE